MGVAGRNVIVGTVGKCFDEWLIKKSLRKCSVLGSMRLGVKLANSTYTGILGMLQSKKADLYLRGEPDYLHEDWLQKSVPIQMEQVILGHSLMPNKVSYFNLLDNFNVGITLSAVYLLSFVGILAFSFLINELSWRSLRLQRRPVEITKRITSAVSSFGVKRLSAIGVFVLFVHLFLWFTEHFLTNNLQTKKVVVDTSQLIKDEHDIFSTQKVACMLENDQLHNMLASSLTKNILWRIYHEKNLLRPDMKKERKLIGKDRCLIARDARMFQLLHSDIFFLTEKKAAELFLNVIFFGEQLFKKLWLSKNSIFEYNKVIYYSLRNPANKEMVSRATTFRTEHGLMKRMETCMAQSAKSSCRASSITVIEDVDQYTEQYMVTSDLVLDNFRYIFLYHFFVCSLLFLAFCVHHLVSRIKKIVLFIRSALIFRL